jgi:cyclin-dependent kinase regulatory subunit CKS1
VQQSRGWVHYAMHKPEPHILLFRRPVEIGIQQTKMQQQLQQTS